MDFQLEEIDTRRPHDQYSPLGSVHICDFGDGGAGEGATFPRIGHGEAVPVRASCSLRTEKDGAALCEWLRMKFSAGFLQWEPSEASRGYESYRPTHDVLNQNLEPRDALCFGNEYSEEARNKQ